jgi:hypothetical protein
MLGSVQDAADPSPSSTSHRRTAKPGSPRTGTAPAINATDTDPTNAHANGKAAGRDGWGEP